MRPTLTHALKLLAFVAILPLVTLSSGRTTTTEANALVVNTIDDGGPGSFRQALSAAGNNPGLDVITFDPAVFPEANPATIHPAAGYAIEGDAASQPLTIDGTGAGVIFDLTSAIAGGAAIHFRASGPVSGITLKHFTIENFAPSNPDDGNGIEIGFQTTSISDVLIDHMLVRNNGRTGILLGAADAMTNVVIRDTEVSDNGQTGVAINAASMDNVSIERNNILGNAHHGLEIEADSSSSPATVKVTASDVSHNGGEGIFVSNSSSGFGPHVTISQNKTTANSGLGINLVGGTENGFGVTANDAGDTDDGPNKLLNFPVLNGVAPTGIVGTACAHCTIELFIGDGDSSGHGEGAGYFATGTADGDGNFNINGCGQNQGASVTATATDPDGNTSEFAENYTLPTKPPCIQHKNGDLDCDDDVDGRDALIAVIHDSGANQIARGQNCPELGSAVTTAALAQPAGGSNIFGDVNCDTHVNAGDAITILQHTAEVRLVPTPPAGCVPVGDPLP